MCVCMFIYTPLCLIIHAGLIFLPTGPERGHRTWSGVPVRVRAGSQEVLLWVGSLFRSGCHGPGTGGLHGAVRGGPHKACLSGFPQDPLALVALPNTRRFPQHPLGSPPISYYWLSVVFVLRVALSKTLSALPPSCLRGHHGGPQGFPGSLRPLAGRDWQSSHWKPPQCVRARPADGVAEGCGCSVMLDCSTVTAHIASRHHGWSSRTVQWKCLFIFTALRSSGSVCAFCILVALQ